MEHIDPSNFSAIDPDSDEVSRMLESLASASAELEFIVQRLSEQLSKLGSRLRKTLLNEIRTSRQRVQDSLNSYLNAADRDKDELLTQLSQFRHNEIRSIMDAAKVTRQQMREQSVQLFSEYSNKVRQNLDTVRSAVTTTKPEMEIEGHQSKVTSVAREITEKINELYAEYNRRFPELLKDKMKALDEHMLNVQKEVDTFLIEKLDNVKEELDSFSERTAEAAETKLVNQQAKFNQVLKNIETGEKNLPQRLFFHWKDKQVSNYFDEVIQSFENSLLAASELQASTYQSKLRSITNQSKLEVANSARNCEEEMKAVHTEFLALLAEQQRESWIRCDSLLNKLEQAIETQMDSDSNVSERVRIALKNLAQEFRGKTVQKSHQVSLLFEQSINSMIKNIENFGEEASDDLEHEYSQARRDFSLLYEDIEKQLADLLKETAKIEKAGRGVSRIISAYKKSTITIAPDNSGEKPE